MYYFWGFNVYIIIDLVKSNVLTPVSGEVQCCWTIRRSWFARVNALCNLSRKKSREVAAHFQANFWVGIASRCV